MPGRVGGQVEHGALEQAGDGGYLQIPTVDSQFQVAAQVRHYCGYIGEYGGYVDGFPGGLFGIPFETHKGEQLLHQVVEILQRTLDATEELVLFLWGSSSLGVVDQKEQTGQGGAELVGDGAQQLLLPFDEAADTVCHVVKSAR